MKRPEFTNDDDAFHAFNDLMTEVGGDPEDAHSAGDAFLMAVLSQNGFPKLVAAYGKATEGWWYA